MVNFLFDSTQDLHISAPNLYKWFGVSASTGQAKSKIIRDLLKIPHSAGAPGIILR
jgi:hypothetical protein